GKDEVASTEAHPGGSAHPQRTTGSFEILGEEGAPVVAGLRAREHGNEPPDLDDVLTPHGVARLTVLARLDERRRGDEDDSLEQKEEVGHPDRTEGEGRHADRERKCPVGGDVAALPP